MHNDSTTDSNRIQQLIRILLFITVNYCILLAVKLPICSARSIQIFFSRVNISLISTLVMRERESCHNHTLVCDSLGPVSLLCSVTDDLWAPCQFAKIINRPWLISFPPTFDSGEFLSSFFFFSSSTFLIRRGKLHGERISHSGQCESNFDFADLCVLR